MIVLPFVLSILATEATPASAPIAEPATTRDNAHNFSAELATLFHAAACAHLDVAAPPAAPNAHPVVHLDAKIIDAHCQALEPDITRYSEFWQREIEPTIAQIVPRTEGKTIVYPFGGGDLVTALGTYREAREITTLSLECTGDPRGLTALSADRLRSELKFVRANLEKLYRVKHSRTDNLKVMSRGGVSGELVFALTAMRIRKAEPIALRYFDLQADGTLDYMSDADLSKIDTEIVQKKRDARGAAWAFANVEIEFRKLGENDTRIFRHIGANLDDEHLAKSPGVLAHLKRKGRVMAITKAASYLLWWDSFSAVRAYLTHNVDFMISDSTGIPPDVAAAAGFKQYTFGTFEGPYLGDTNSRAAHLFKDMWRKQPHRNINFRYGYPDVHKNAHMLVTTKLDWSEPQLAARH